MEPSCHETSGLITLISYSSFFSLGFLTSLHCVGMCGPLSTLFLTHSQRFKIMPSLMYNAMRAVSYVVVSGLIYILGKQIFPQQIRIPVAIGIAVTVIALGLMGWRGSPRFFSKQIKWVSFLMKRNANPYVRASILGLATGIFPCGLLYSAYSAAVALPSLQTSTIAILSFALGTAPALIGVHIFGINLAAKLPYRYRPVLINGLAVVSIASIFWFNFRAH